MALSVYTANQILNAMVGRSQWASLAGTAYLGFLTEAPNTGTGGEQTYVEPYSSTILDNGYARILIGHWQNSGGCAMSAAASGVCSNTIQIAGTECVNEDWPGIRCFAIFNASTGGNLICWGYLQDSVGQPLVNPVYVTQGKIPVFRIGALQLSFALSES